MIQFLDQFMDVAVFVTVILGVAGIIWLLFIGVLLMKAVAWVRRRLDRWVDDAIDGAIEEIAEASAHAQARGDRPW